MLGGGEEMTANKVSIERLKELEAKATPGPWKFVNYNGYDQWGSLLNKRAGTADSWDSLSTGRVHTANALFIAEMRNALPQLLDRLEKLEEENDALRQSLALADSPDAVEPGFWGRMCAFYSIRNKRLEAVVEAAEADMEANIHNDIPVCPRLRAALEALEMSNKPSNNLSNKLEDR